MNTEHQLLALLSDLSRQLALETAAKGGVPALTRVAMERLNCPVALVDTTGQVLVWHAPEGAGLVAEERLSLPASLATATEVPVQGVIGIAGVPRDVSLWPVGEPRPSAYLIVLTPKERLNDLALAAMEQIRWAVFSEFNRQRELRVRGQKARDNFLQDLLFNNITGWDDTVFRGKQWGWDLELPHLVVTILNPDGHEVSDSEHDPKRQALEEYLAGAYPDMAVTRNAGALVVLVPYRRETDGSWKAKVRKLVEDVKQLFVEKTNAALYAGCGKLYPSASLLYRSYQEAKTALELGRLFKMGTEVVFFDEAGAVRLFYNQGEQELDEFFMEALGPVVDYDRERNSNLLESLWQYFVHAKDLASAASHLCVHPNTMRYRLKKVEELLEIDLNDAETGFNIYAALKVGTLRGKLEQVINR